MGAEHMIILTWVVVVAVIAMYYAGGIWIEALQWCVTCLDSGWLSFGWWIIEKYILLDILRKTDYHHLARPNIISFIPTNAIT